MVLIYSSREGKSAVAIVDGFIPRKDRIEEIVHSFRDVGARDPLDGSNLEVLPSFLAVTEALNDTYAVISGAGIQHYLIYLNPSSRNGQTRARSNRGPSGWHSQFDYVITTILESNQCLNLVIDSVTGDEKRIRNYILFWKLATQFRLKGPKDYDDHDKFQMTCQNLLGTLDASADASIVKYLSGVEKDGLHFYYKAHSEHYFPKPVRLGNS